MTAIGTAATNYWVYGHGLFWSKIRSHSLTEDKSIGWINAFHLRITWKFWRWSTSLPVPELRLPLGLLQPIGSKIRKQLSNYWEYGHGPLFGSKTRSYALTEDGGQWRTDGWINALRLRITWKFWCWSTSFPVPELWLPFGLLQPIGCKIRIFFQIIGCMGIVRLIF